MCVLADNENFQSAFLGLKRRRDCGRVPYGALFGAVFAFFGTFFTKSDLFFTKTERNRAVFTDFEKSAAEIALNRKIRTYG